jgi:hypothetical protein
VNPIEQRQRIRLGRMANRCGCRIARPKPEDRIDHGAYRLVDLVNNRVLLGEEFEATLAEIEAYLKRERNPKKTPEENHDNIVRQLAAQRGYLVRKSRPQLFSQHSGEYQLFQKSDPTTPVVIIPDRSPTLDEVEAFLRAQPVGSQKRFYSPRPRGAERVHHA